MSILERTARGRAMQALSDVVGVEPVGERLIGSMPSRIALDVGPINLLIAAGDNIVELDCYELVAMSMREGRDVLATYVDTMKSGHRFPIDIVLRDPSGPVWYQAYRLWRGTDQSWAFVSEYQHGPTIRVGVGGLKKANRLWKLTPFERLTGVARGQDWLQQRIQQFDAHPRYIGH